MLVVWLLWATLSLAARTPDTIRASYYHPKFNGRTTASGSKYWAKGYTAANLTLPFGTLLEVTNINTGQSIYVEITDRGPYSDKYKIDLSQAAAEAIGITHQNGWAWVTLRKIK